jgi:hypothetical protein
MKHKIRIVEWEWECGDRCCTDYGTNVFIDDIQLEGTETLTSDILEKVLRHFKIECEIEEDYEG